MVKRCHRNLTLVYIGLPMAKLASLSVPSLPAVRLLRTVSEDLPIALTAPSL